MNNYKKILLPLAVEAGEEIMKYFCKECNVSVKKDNSPVTDADFAANSVIISRLKDTGIPIISEENRVSSYEIRKKWKKFWLIDPLDGTKQFVNNDKQFTVNIALIKNNMVEEGVVYLPAMKILYYGNIYDGAVKIDFNISGKESNLPTQNNTVLHVIASRSHLNTQTKKYLENLRNKVGDIQICNVGSSLKFCSVADGVADIYPRIGCISEWDIAAGHAIVKSAGGNVIDMNSHEEVKYNSRSLETPDFIAFKSRDKLEKIL